MHIDNYRQRPGSIRNRILIFSILVTLVPSIGMGWFWYDLSRKTTTAKLEQKLATSADIVEREIGLWFKERNYDLRVFSNSFVVAENLAIYQQESQNGNPPSRKSEAALKKINTYLRLIKTQFKNYHRLSILNGDGRVLASSSPPAHEKFVALPDSWQQQVIRNQYFVGDYFSTDEEGAPLALVGIPLLSSEHNTVIGFFILDVHLDSVQSLLYSSLPARNTAAGCCNMTLFETNGRIIFGTAPVLTLERPDIASAETMKLFDKPRILQEYINNRQVQVLGMAFLFKDLPWSILIEESKNTVYSGLIEARDKILLITALMTIIIGGSAIIIARQILFPLKALTAAVLQVAQGDLEVTVPVSRNDELGIVTDMFNDMVHRLGESQSRLEELATTDSLTGLANRKQIMATLDLQMEGFCRHGTDFAILMLDIDYFKKVNDTYGHQAGDAVLAGLAVTLNSMLRTLDTAGRYGGEEFMVILDTTDIDQAAQTAERIRQAVEIEVFSWQEQEIRTTVSVGVAAISIEDASIANLIGRVDQALYKAKAEGRNRVCQLEIPDGLKEVAAQ